MMRQNVVLRGTRRFTALGVFVAALAACGSADPKLYTLQPVPGTATPGGPRVIELRRPGLAGYLDRSDIVLKGASYQLDVASSSRWAEPFGDMIGRVLSQDLSQRLPGTTVFTQSGAITADPEVRVEVDVLRFDADAARQVTLTADIAIERGHAHTPASAAHISVTAQTNGVGVGPLVAAMSELLGNLADNVASDLRSLDVQRTFCAGNSCADRS